MKRYAVLLFAAALIACEEAPVAPPFTPPVIEQQPKEEPPVVTAAPSCIRGVGPMPFASDLIGSWRIEEEDYSYTLILGSGSWSVEDGPSHLHPGGDLSYWSYGKRQDAFGSTSGDTVLALYVRVAPLPIKEWLITPAHDGGYCLGYSGRMTNADR